MKLARRSRVIAALIALISVLFTQLAVAAYACPDTQVVQLMNAAAISAAHAPHDFSDCDHTEQRSWTPCQLQWQIGTQSLDKPELPQVAPFIAFMQKPAYAGIDALQAFMPIAIRRDGPVRIVAPSLSIRHCCFRI